MGACVSAPSVEANAGVVGGDDLFGASPDKKPFFFIPVCCFEGRGIGRPDGAGVGGANASRTSGGGKWFLSKVASRGLLKLLFCGCSVSFCPQPPSVVYLFSVLSRVSRSEKRGRLKRVSRIRPPGRSVAVPACTALGCRGQGRQRSFPPVH